MFKNKYRIVINDRSRYKVQTKFWWCPFLWTKSCLSYKTLEEAKDHIEYLKRPEPKIVKVVKYID